MKENIKKTLEKFAEEHGCILNPDKDVSNRIIETLIRNEEKHGKRYCPCQPNVTCPCGFLDSNFWKEKGRCYCGLFLKKEK